MPVRPERSSNLIAAHWLAEGELAAAAAHVERDARVERPFDNLPQLF